MNCKKKKKIEYCVKRYGNDFPLPKNAKFCKGCDKTGKDKKCLK